MFHDDQSVFGPTMEGVVNPRVPHAHPYPTRYHGGVWTTPVFGQPYRSQSYMAGRPGYESQWLQLSGAGPDGLGEPLLCSSSGSTLLDAALGGALGYIAAPKGSKPEWWAAAGASATALAGLMGAVCVVGAALLSRSKRKLAVANGKRNPGRHQGRRWTSSAEYYDRPKASPAELSEMKAVLRRYGYAPTAAQELIEDGMGPYELEERLRFEPAGLTRTHGIKRLAPNRGSR